MSIIYYLGEAVGKGASDIFVIAGGHISFKIDGIITRIGEEKINQHESEELIREIFALSNRSIDGYIAKGDDDFSFSLSGLSRFRVSAYRQRGSMAAVIRIVSFDIPDFRKLNIPSDVIKIAELNRGLVLVTGPTGCGKSTTLTCMIDDINKKRNAHVITLEDPIEYLYRNDKSIVSQREIAIDTDDYLTALRASLRQAPDVIQLGEMRDFETIRTAMTAAETGHLVLSTLHTIGAVNTIDRIIDVFPPNQQHQVRMQLSMILTSVISQQLLPDEEGGLIPAFEIMHITPAIRNMIREGKTYQIDNVIQTSSSEGMMNMDSYIINLYKAGKVSELTAILYAINPEQLQRKLRGLYKE